jgi:tol-pal system protein YbgF
MCWGLPAVCAFSGCGIQREYVRRGQLLDSLAVRTSRLEAGQTTQQEEMGRLRADVLTELEGLGTREEQLAAQLNDLGDRLDRISRRLGLGRGNVTPVGAESAKTQDTTRAPVDSAGLGQDQLYNTAYLDFTRGKYDVAVTEFRQYVQRFPTSDNADNAQYWIGECYYSQGRYQDAEKEFRQVLTAYPDGNKAPSAAYKLALVYLAEKRKPEARNQFKRVVQQYSGSNEAKLAQARLESGE